jgi:D-xylose reductase
MSSKNLPKYFESQKIKIPSVGLGTAYMTTDISELVYSSIKDGTRLIDTAAVYGSEEGVGKGVKKAIKEGIIKREDLFITTKLSKYEMTNPESCIKKSLKNLDMDYIDLYLIHWPKFFDYDKKGNKINLVPLHKIWPIMESFVEKGYTKYIGVSNFNVQSLLNLLSFCKIKPLVNEIEFHPYLFQKQLVNFCRREDIILFGYNPLVKGCYCADTAEENMRNLLGEKIILDLSKKYNKTVGQIVLNWSISREVIPIPMTSNLHRMKENLESTEFIMDKSDLEKIDDLNRNQRYGQSGIWNIYDNQTDVFA